MEKKLVSVSCILFLSLAFPITSVSATSVGISCSKVGALAGTKKNPIVCKKVRKKLIWRKDLAPTTTTTIAPTTTTTIAPTTTTTVAPTTTTTTTTTTIPLWTARTYSGSGTKVIDIELPSSQLATITMRHNGNRNFIIWSNTSNFGRLDLLANVIGDYSGTRVVKDGTARKLEITSDGDWNVVIDVAARAPEMTGTYSGSGDCVLRYNLGAAILRLTNSGESNFVIWSFLESGSYGDLLANEIGDADLTKIIRTGKYLEVRSQGSWSIARQ